MKILPIHPNLKRTYSQHFMCTDSSLIFCAERLAIDRPFGEMTRGVRIRHDSLEYDARFMDVDQPLAARAIRLDDTLYQVKYAAAYMLMGLYFEWKFDEQVKFFLFEFRSPDQSPTAYPPFEHVSYELYGVLYDKVYEFGVLRYQSSAVPLSPYANALIRYAKDPHGVWSGGEIFQMEEP